MSTDTTTAEQQAVTGELVMPENDPQFELVQYDAPAGDDQPREVIDVTPASQPDAAQRQLFDVQVDALEGELIDDAKQAAAENGFELVEHPPGSAARFTAPPIDSDLERAVAQTGWPDAVCDDGNDRLPFDLDDENDDWCTATAPEHSPEDDNFAPDDDYAIGASESAEIEHAGMQRYEDLVEPYEPSFWEWLLPWSDYNIRRKTAARIDAMDASAAARVMQTGTPFERSIAARKLGIYGGQQRAEAPTSQSAQQGGGINVQINTGDRGEVSYG